LVCYAVGGLDCRTLASAKGLFSGDPDTYAIVRQSIASITTISTPHRGTRVADASVIALETGTQSDLIESITGLDVPTSIASGALLDSLRAITLDAASRRSAILTDGDGIYYQSFAGVSHVAGDANAPTVSDVTTACGLDSSGAVNITGGTGTIDFMQPQLWVTAPLGGASEDDSGNISVSPTDGMVAVESAKWGTFRGCIPSDHYHVIGQLHRSSRDVMTGFDAGRFYSWLVNDLASKGF
jgi:triacylglycerol esterase/lipase EstA (alpha/beta hydrolase family)